jgi:hypothetical protein
VLIRHALSWALAVKDPNAFVTKVRIFIPHAKLETSDKTRQSDFEEEEDEAKTKVTVQIVKTPRPGA